MPSEDSFIPIDLREFSSTLFGNRVPLSASDYSENELEAIRAAIVRNQDRTGNRKVGSVGYEDYPQGDEIGPGYKPIETLLGRFKYSVEPDGSTRVLDRYDFWNKERAPNVSRYEQMSGLRRGIEAPLTALGFLLSGRPRSAAGELGDAFIGREGRPVNIRIPPVKKADGGSVNAAELTQLLTKYPHGKPVLDAPMLERTGKPWAPAAMDPKFAEGGSVQAPADYNADYTSALATQLLDETYA